MKKLNEKEAVHCRTQEQFDKVVKELEKQGHKWFSEKHGGFGRFKEKTCLSFFNDGKHIGHLSYAYTDVYKERNYKILTYSEFMGDSWTPKKKEPYWLLGIQSTGVYVMQAVNYYPFDDENIKSNNYFRTRQLAREAKKAIQEVLKKARKG